jgi:hypothetical protein
MNNSELAKAQALQQQILAHPPRKFADGQIVVVKGERVSIVASVMPDLLEDSTFTWLYFCPHIESPICGEYLSETELTELKQS